MSDDIFPKVTDGPEDDPSQAHVITGKGVFNADGSEFRFGKRPYVWVGGTKCYRSYSDYCD